MRPSIKDTPAPGRDPAAPPSRAGGLLFECFPGGWHPYQELFARALVPYGYRFHPGDDFSDRTLATRAGDLAGIHFHWVEYLWGTSRPWTRAGRLFGLRSYCRLARRLGLRVVWTVHNHAGHEGAAWGDGIGFRIIARAADLVIAHSRWSEAHVRRALRPAGRVVYMPLGNFDGFYSPRRPPRDVRAAYGLADDRPVCGLIGGVRPYRGHELAVEAVRRMGGRVRLLIAGPAIDTGYQRSLQDLAASCPFVTFVPGKLTDAEYAEAVQACDIILLPYQAITGSAALLAAWTLGRPVVLSDLPYFRELCPADGMAGVILSGRSPELLAAAIDRVLAIPAAARQAAAWREADRYSWDQVIKPVADVLCSWGTGGRAPGTPAPLP
jgi:glycosyltransferase involved in cell wall biosynthesis